jgi:2-dehydropantoate 2-reductase
MGARRYALIGPGAVGLLYGGRLAAAGHELHVVGRSDVAHLRSRGLVLESSYGDVSFDTVSAFTDVRDVPEVDVVLVGLKTTANHLLPELLAPFARPDVTIVMLQNGLGVEAIAAGAAPGATVLGGLCFVCALKLGPGHARHVDYGAVTLAEHGASSVTEAVCAVADDLEAAGVEVTREGDLFAARWRKLVWNVPYNGLSVLLDAGTDELMTDPAARALVVDLMNEVADGARACGRPLPEGFVVQMLSMTDAMVPYRTSMKTDHDAGLPLELDAIYGAPVTTAAAAGCRMQRVEALWRALQFLDSRRNKPH